jgi:16S rRNA processing protein RimM
VHNEEEYVVIGIIGKAHGIKGEVQIIPITDEPEQFQSLKTIYVNSNGRRTTWGIEQVRFAADKILIKFDQLNDRTIAQNYHGSQIERKRSDLQPLSDNEYYIFQLIGLKVETDEGCPLGELIDVWKLPANDVYVVQDGQKELLIPAIKDVIKEIDLKHQKMVIIPMAGLFE